MLAADGESNVNWDKPFIIKCYAAIQSVGESSHGKPLLASMIAKALAMPDCDASHRYSNISDPNLDQIQVCETGSAQRQHDDMVSMCEFRHVFSTRPVTPPPTHG